MAKIVIIDDEPAMVEVIVTLCREKGHQVFPFNAPSKAIEQLDAIQPEVVITDIKMETMTGFDVLRHVRAPIFIAWTAVSADPNAVMRMTEVWR